MADKYLRILDRSYQQFLNSLKSQPISQYFNIDKYQIQCNQNELYNYTLTLQHDSKSNVYVFQHTILPTDILYLIYCFSKETTILVSTIIFTTDYPFKPYKWIVESYLQTKYNKNQNKIIKKTDQSILDKKVAFYNRQLIDSWMTSSLFEEHIISYITYVLPII
jgi:hypothetical protein